ncbi:peptidoglycan DD-metalloendopeptidase family protein [Candidatus Peregrinibacteria bacterium]|nr:peptidoglycan DD-metalloendopeptidase family protein [Candidatus Peregrinibacteria bacterium]
MKRLVDYYVVALFLTAFIVGNSLMTSANSDDMRTFVLDSNAGEELSVDESREEEVISEGEQEKLKEEVVSEGEQEKLKENEKFKEKLDQELLYSKADYRQLLNNITDTKYQLDILSEQKLSLSSQIANLDLLISETSEKLLKVFEQIVQTENDIKALYEQIEFREIELNYQKDLLEDYIRILYVEENEYFTFDENGNVDAFKLLLSDTSVGDIVKELKYFDLLNDTGQQLIEKIDVIQNELQAEKSRLDLQKSNLMTLEEELQMEMDNLELQKEAKENLLDMTSGQEDIYTQLLDQTLEEQEAVVEDIKSLSSAIAFIEDEIMELGVDFDPTKYESLLSDRGKALYDFQVRYRTLNFDGFAWPVEPIKGLSAYFRDPGYADVFGVKHNAIDIPVYQATPVRSAADGVVYAVKDNGYGYSYIIVVHSKGFSSVYGHISSILVDEGDTVPQGTILGLSGGMPGTKGAGYMTTGPHLHFELLLDGSYIDPLKHLPLSVLSEEEISKLPEKYLELWEEQVFGKELIER